ncbi:MAG: hypothetical protein APF77_21640 [Clostridia bacterium BRH_c25]|nr:MAG: hypothetical protein APF77_21640 [Clostridia bacterium BRH_c25]
MIGITRQLSKYFIFITMFSIIFITIISNVSINLFFSNYIKESRSRDDLKIVQYVEQVYSNNNGLNSQSLMNIMHYAYSEAVIVQLRNSQNKIVWSSGTPETMHNIMGGNDSNDNSLAFRSYPFNYKDSKIGTIDVGRPKSIISSIEDKQFLRTINIVFAAAFLFSVIIAILSSSRISKKFLEPIYLIKENAKLIKNEKYKELNEVRTNTYELHDLSVSVKELAEKLEYQAALRKRMTSDIAHELRTPLATIQSHIEAFMDGVWEPNSEKLTIIHDEIFRLTKLIKDLSDLSNVESDEIKLKKSEINLSALMNNIAESFEPLFISKSINFKKEIQSNVKLSGDADRLNQVFTNILSNAYKYTNENGIVRVGLKQLKDVIRVTVEDTGIGIPKEDIKHVFERFYRSDLSRNRGTGGTGIGLTITKAYIEAHDGRIRIESEEGNGTKVIIDFMR